MLTEEQISCYLARIGLPADFSARTDADTLRALTFAHVTHVPYENLGILRGEEGDLTEAGLFRKIVEEQQGGYCFELNGAFGCLLRAIGFPVRDRFARFLYRETAVPMRRHRVLEVQCGDGLYLADVGIGCVAPKLPVKIDTALPQTLCGDTWRVQNDGRTVTLELQTSAGFVPYDAYPTSDEYDVDFLQPDFYCRHSPASPFNRAPMLSLKTADGRRTVDGDTYRVWVGDTVSYEECGMSPERYREVLSTVFGLN